MIFIMLFFEMASRLEETMVYMLTKARCHAWGYTAALREDSMQRDPHGEEASYQSPHGQPWWGAPQQWVLQAPSSLQMIPAPSEFETSG